MPNQKNKMRSKVPGSPSRHLPRNQLTRKDVCHTPRFRIAGESDRHPVKGSKFLQRHLTHQFFKFHISFPPFTCKMQKACQASQHLQTILKALRTIDIRIKMTISSTPNRHFLTLPQSLRVEIISEKWRRRPRCRHTTITTLLLTLIKNSLTEIRIRNLNYKENCKTRDRLLPVDKSTQTQNQLAENGTVLPNRTSDGQKQSQSESIWPQQPRKLPFRHSSQHVILIT